MLHREGTKTIFISLLILALPYILLTQLEHHANTRCGRLYGAHRAGLGQGLAQIRLEKTHDFGFERRLIKGLGHAAILAARAAARRVAVR